MNYYSGCKNWKLKKKTFKHYISFQDEWPRLPETGGGVVETPAEQAPQVSVLARRADHHDSGISFNIYNSFVFLESIDKS